MLILSRHVGEKIIIGDDIQITFLGFNRQYRSAKFGILAPLDIEVHREEVYERVLLERLHGLPSHNKKASGF